MADSTRNWLPIAFVAGMAMLSCCTCSGLFAVAASSRDASEADFVQREGSAVRAAVEAQAVATSDTLNTGAADPQNRSLPADGGHQAPDEGHPASPADPAPRSSNPVSDLRALGDYAKAVKPLIDEGLSATQRDGDILRTAESRPDLPCGSDGGPHPQLVADAALMHGLAERLGGMSPPPEAASTVHQPLVDSARLWGDALDDLNESCHAGPVRAGVLRLGAAAQLGSSMLSFRVAHDSYWRLVLANGLEAFAE